MIRLLVLLLIISVPGSAAELKKDIENGRVGKVSLKLDAQIPDGSGPFPAVIFVHGGGFTRGDKQAFPELFIEPLMNAGFGWFSVNYRLAPQHTFPVLSDDVERPTSAYDSPS